MEQSTKKKFETVIGLEVHLQFDTKTKIFCGCANAFGKDPNTLTCPVCLGLPGSLPVLNKQALYSAIKVALALNCEVNPFIKFDRKNYYYPDLPKGYQISQFDLPIAKNGHVMIPSGSDTKKIRIHRAHLEEDAGKLIHDQTLNCSFVDYNRTGTPLMEIVTEADLRTPQEAYDYLQTLKLTLQYLNVSDCDMEKGSLRCDANISIREYGAKEFGTKAEVKNMNSFRAVKSALEFEEQRQEKLILAGERVIQETRLWDETKQMTFPMRSKEEAHDYRYFPEPDLVPFSVSESEIDEVKRGLPELPQKKQERFIKQYALSEYDSRIIVQDQELADFFELCAKDLPETKKIANWVCGPLLFELNERRSSIRKSKLKPEYLTAIIRKVEDQTISNLVGKEVLKMTIESGKAPDAIISEGGLAQVSDESELAGIIDQVILGNATVVDQFKSGKDTAIGFLIGQAMKKTQGKANPKKIGELMRRRLSNG